MRLLFVVQSSPWKQGGSETRAREIALRLARAGHEITVLCGKTDAEDADEVLIEGIRILTRNTLPRFLLRYFPHPHPIALAAANLCLMFHLPRLLRSQRFDLVREDIAPVPASFLLSLLRLPVARRVAVAHNLPGSLSGWLKHYGPVFGPVGYAMDRLLRAGMLKYDEIVCAAGWLAQDLKRSARIAGKVRYVPNGVDLARFLPTNRTRRAQEEPLRLLCVGRLAEIKGHRYAIEALGHLKGTSGLPLLRLTIVGSGPLRAALLDLGRDLGVADSIEILSPIEHHRMPEIYRAHDFFVLPSTWEGQPISLIEAMASKLPVIATRIPAVADLLGEESAALASPGDGRSLAAALSSAIRHTELTQRRTEAALAIAQRFDWAAAAAQEIAP